MKNIKCSLDINKYQGCIFVKYTSTSPSLYQYCLDKVILWQKK